MLADRALASETDVEESKPGVAEIKIDKTAKSVGLLEDLEIRDRDSSRKVEEFRTWTCK